MRIEDLPKSAKRKLEEQRSLRNEGERERVETQKSRSNNKPFKTKVGDSIKLLENREKTLQELQQEYKIDGAADVICNTQKLQKVNVRDVFNVARTAGHFGMFCSCGVLCAADIFYLDESLSQTQGFLVKLFQSFPEQFEPVDRYFTG